MKGNLLNDDTQYNVGSQLSTMSTIFQKGDTQYIASTQAFPITCNSEETCVDGKVYEWPSLVTTKGNNSTIVQWFAPLALTSKMICKFINPFLPLNQHSARANSLELA